MRRSILLLLIGLLLLAGCVEKKSSNIIEYAGERFDISHNESCWYVDEEREVIYLFTTQVCGGQFGFDELEHILYARCGWLCNPYLPPVNVTGTFTVNANESVKVYSGSQTWYVS